MPLHTELAFLKHQSHSFQCSVWRVQHWGNPQSILVTLSNIKGFCIAYSQFVFFINYIISLWNLLHLRFIRDYNKTKVDYTWMCSIGHLCQMLTFFFQMEDWYWDINDIKNSPSSKVGIDYATETRYRTDGAKFISAVGQQLKLYP